MKHFLFLIWQHLLFPMNFWSKNHIKSPYALLIRKIWNNNKNLQCKSVQIYPGDLLANRVRSLRAATVTSKSAVIYRDKTQAVFCWVGEGLPSLIPDKIRHYFARILPHPGALLCLISARPPPHQVGVPWVHLHCVQQCPDKHHLLASVNLEKCWALSSAVNQGIGPDHEIRTEMKAAEVTSIYPALITDLVLVYIWKVCVLVQMMHSLWIINKNKATAICVLKRLDTSVVISSSWYKQYKSQKKMLKKPYSCTACKLSFALTKDLLLHVKRDHLKGNIEKRMSNTGE